jgi:hypothetical protein
MKKSPAKLILSRESLHLLTTPSQLDVAKGASNNGCGGTGGGGTFCYKCLT